MNKKKRRRRMLVPRLGPPQNLRSAGAHESKKHYNRKRCKAALERSEEDGFFMMSGAFRLSAGVVHWPAGYTPIPQRRNSTS
jgi:hypothetical protein